MKIIGAELRIGANGFQAIEAKIIPLEVQIPEVFTLFSYRQPEMEITIHTSDGDFNATVRLEPRGLRDISRSVSEQEFIEGYKELQKRIEAMK